MYIIVIILSSFLNIANTEIESDTFKDPRDGNEYKTVVIGGQTWMSENLKYKTEGAIPYNNNTDNIALYGYLYDWETSQNVCPKGWHLPNEEEWNQLIDFLGGKNKAGGKMKSKSAEANWTSPNRFATNSSGFNAFPSAISKSGVFSSLKDVAYFWSSEAECTSAYTVYLTYKAGFADKKVTPKTDMVAIRCIKN
tara:strand:+ start:1068 stop:1652 length:585 start_codon:yes stop_codon:yes gene_type:complete